MKLLFITTEPPWPPRGGAVLRTYNLMVRLAERHRVYLACPATAHQAAELQVHFGDRLAGIVTVPPAPRRSLPTRALGMLTSQTPDLAMRCYQPQLAHAVWAQWGGEGLEVAHLVGLEAVGLAMGPAWSPLPAKAVVLDELNAEYLLQQHAYHVAKAQPGHWVGAAYSWAQTRKLQTYERMACRAADRVVAVSDEDAGVLRALAPGVGVDVVANGVDVARYSPAGYAPQPGVVVFTGTMDFRPNVDGVCWFAEHVWPRVRAAHAGAQFIIAGRNPAPAVRALAAADITVTGAIEDDLPYLEGTSVFVVPIRFGGGSRLKVLQALSCGLPIVATEAGAAGVRVADGEHLLVADDPAAFADATVRLLTDRELATRLGLAGRALAAHYDWDILVERLERTYQDVLAGVAQA